MNYPKLLEETGLNRNDLSNEYFAQSESFSLEITSRCVEYFVRFLSLN